MEQMREKYESLSAFVLKDLAKARGIKGVSSLKKGQIIERMLEEDAKEAEEDIRRASSSNPASNMASTRRSMRAYSSSRGSVTPIFTMSNGRCLRSPVRCDEKGLPVCRQTSTARSTRAGFRKSTSP